MAVVAKMMNFNDLDARSVREKVDMTQLWEAWINADDPRRTAIEARWAGKCDRAMSISIPASAAW
jgi:hypothetical protein